MTVQIVAWCPRPYADNDRETCPSPTTNHQSPAIASPIIQSTNHPPNHPLITNHPHAHPEIVAGQPTRPAHHHPTPPAHPELVEGRPTSRKATPKGERQPIIQSITPPVHPEPAEARLWRVRPRDTPPRHAARPASRCQRLRPPAACRRLAAVVFCGARFALLGGERLTD